MLNYVFVIYLSNYVGYSDTIIKNIGCTESVIHM